MRDRWASRPCITLPGRGLEPAGENAQLRPGSAVRGDGGADRPQSPRMISVPRARELIRLRAPGPEPESVATEAAGGRTLAAPVRAAGAVPPFAGSAMDGYAIAASAAGTRLTVIGESRAGAPWGGRLTAGQAVRISTGAMVPQGARSVVRQEDVRRLDGPGIELQA